MKFLNTLKAERSIAQFLEEPDVASPGARKAAESLKKAGPGAIPKVIEAMAMADKSQSTVLVETLASQLNDKTFAQFADGLRHGNARCVTGVARALSSSATYDSTQLLALLGE